jgi:hypothetical protein
MRRWVTVAVLVQVNMIATATLRLVSTDAALTVLAGLAALTALYLLLSR